MLFHGSVFDRSENDCNSLGWYCCSSEFSLLQKLLWLYCEYYRERYCFKEAVAVNDFYVDLVAAYVVAADVVVFVAMRNAVAVDVVAVGC